MPEAVTCWTGIVYPSADWCCAWCIRVVEPITDAGSPYSDVVHDVEYVTRTLPSLQVSVEAWCTLKLCPSSWATVRRLGVPLIQAPDQPR